MAVHCRLDSDIGSLGQEAAQEIGLPWRDRKAEKGRIAFGEGPAFASRFLNAIATLTSLVMLGAQYSLGGN